MTGVPRYFFMENSKLEILEQPVSDLNLSAGCKTYLKNNGIGKLREVICKGWKGMRQTDGFDYVLFNEVIRFLDDAGLVHLMEK
jgi:hypothetical protein